MNRSFTWLWMIPLLAGIAIIQSVIGPHISLATVHPDFMLVFIVTWTLLYGARESLVWAFVGGLWLDVLSGGPMGGSSLALMAASLVTGLGRAFFFRKNIFVPAGMVMVSTFVFGSVHFLVLALVNRPLPFWATMERIIAPSILYNGGIAVLLTPLLNRVPEQQEAG